jgi:hypothetical protein
VIFLVVQLPELGGRVELLLLDVLALAHPLSVRGRQSD